MSLSIYLHNIPQQALDNLICINTGSIKSSDFGYGDVFFPKKDWQAITKSCDFLSLNKSKSINRSVSILDTDPYLRELFWNKIVSLLPKCKNDIREKVIKNFSEEVIKRLETYSSIKLLNLYSYELMFNPSGLNSTAYNHKLDTPIGLHIDTHNVKELYLRQEGFQLLSINLGHSERYFYFIELEVKDLIKKLAQKLNKKYEQLLESLSDVNELKSLFLEHFPDYPIKRVTIKPSQAYIAVSQNIIHDGGTNDLGNLDVTLLIGGYYKWLEK